MSGIKDSINDLKNYNHRKIGIINLKERIKILEDKADGLNSVSINSNAIKGGGNVYETALIENIARRQHLQRDLDIAEREVAAIDKALSTLTPEERIILEGFYVSRSSDYRARLCDKLHIEEPTLYRRKDEALHKFILSYGGIKEI